jgi:hypothetical protein
MQQRALRLIYFECCGFRDPRNSAVARPALISIPVITGIESWNGKLRIEPRHRTQSASLPVTQTRGTCTFVIGNPEYSRGLVHGAASMYVRSVSREYD